MYNKEGKLKLEVSAHIKSKVQTNISFFNTDIGTADLVVNLTRNSSPILVSENNVDIFIKLENNDDFIVDTVKILDPLNGLVKYTIPNEFLSLTGTVHGQLYVAINGKDDMVTLAEFTFQIKDALINTIPAVEKLREIRTFQEWRQEVMAILQQIKDGYEESADYLEQLQSTVDSGNRTLNTSVTNGLQTIADVIESNKNKIANETDINIEKLNQKEIDITTNLNTLKDSNISDMTTIKNSHLTEITDIKNEVTNATNDLVNGTRLTTELNNLTWQKHRTVLDTGLVRQIANFDFSKIDSFLTKTELVYVNAALNTPLDVNANGFVSVVFRTNGYGRLEFSPYNSKDIYIKRRVGTTGWTSWEKITGTYEDSGWLPLTLINGVVNDTRINTNLTSYRYVREEKMTRHYIRLNISNVTDDTTIATLPSGVINNYVPKIVPANLNEGIAFLNINTDGTLNIKLEEKLLETWDETKVIYAQVEYID